MARLRDGRHTSATRIEDCKLALLIGPTAADPDEDELRLAWELLHDELMAPDVVRDGRRCWGYWRFEVGEDRPASAVDEVVRLAELGLLTREELAAFHERANEARLRVGTPAERISGGNRESGVSVDVASVELWQWLAEVIA